MYNTILFFSRFRFYISNVNKFMFQADTVISEGTSMTTIPPVITKGKHLRNIGFKNGRNNTKPDEKVI